MPVLNALKLGKSTHWGLSQKEFGGRLDQENENVCKNCENWKLKKPNNNMKNTNAQSQIINWLPILSPPPSRHPILSPKSRPPILFPLRYSSLENCQPWLLQNRDFFNYDRNDSVIVSGCLPNFIFFQIKVKIWNHCATLRNVVARIFGAQLHRAICILLVYSLSQLICYLHLFVWFHSFVV